jgi:lipocalin
MSGFELSKYLGTWYELGHYPSWFQRNDNYNTKAVYGLNTDGSVSVHNSTITQGKPFDSYGSARFLGGTNFRVDFAKSESEKLNQSGQFNMADIPPEVLNNLMTNTGPNYVIDRIWTNCSGQYVFAVVTDPPRQSLYILSRYCHPSLTAYNEIMAYVVANYDRDRLVQTPHFGETYH